MSGHRHGVLDPQSDFPATYKPKPGRVSQRNMCFLFMHTVMLQDTQDAIQIPFSFNSGNTESPFTRGTAPACFAAGSMLMWSRKYAHVEQEVCSRGLHALLGLRKLAAPPCLEPSDLKLHFLLCINRLPSHRKAYRTTAHCLAIGSSPQDGYN